MFVVTVTFVVAPENFPQFSDAVLAQAKNSLALEPDCLVFDVCIAKDQSTFFLYEKYTDADAFDTHLASEHFIDFDALVAPWVTDKKVATWSAAGEHP